MDVLPQKVFRKHTKEERRDEKRRYRQRKKQLKRLQKNSQAIQTDKQIDTAQVRLTEW